MKHNLLDREDKIQATQWIELSLNSTTKVELEENRHDLFYGFIGKAILAQSYNQEYSKPFVEMIIKQLFLNIKHDQFGNYWYTPEHVFTNSSEKRPLILEYLMVSWGFCFFSSSAIQYLN